MSRPLALVVRACLVGVCAAWLHPVPVAAQSVSQRGFVEGAVYVFPQTTPEDHEHVVGDLIAREELSGRVASWLQLTGSLEFRANSHNQVGGVVGFIDRGAKRPQLALRALGAAITRGPFTLHAGKQFIRWGKTDVVVPTDRFAPRDYLNVLDAPFMPVTAVRGTMQLGSHTIDAVWLPIFTPSRVPLADQRWAPRPEGLPPGAALIEMPGVYPGRAQFGVRVDHMAGRVDYALSFYDGFNHEPDLHLTPPDPASATIGYRKAYPSIRTYGGDMSLPLPWVAVKAEAAYFSAPAHDTDEYVLYVIELERQHREWVFAVGYAGEHLRKERSLAFAPDRGLSRSVVARASYTIDANRRVELESAIRQDGDGVYAKGEYSQAAGQHWRTTIAGVFIAGDADDFIGQYRRNSHVRLTVRYSF